MDCFFKIKKLYQHKTILILGLGIQGGWQAADFFYNLGSKVLISDMKTKTQLKASLEKLAKCSKIEYEFGLHSSYFLNRADVIVRNPGVPINSLILKQARALNKKIIMGSSFLLSSCIPMSVGITGTRGKSTTTNFIYQILKNNLKQPVYLAGNLPQYSAFRLINKIKPKDNVVFELSSWELQGFRQAKISPQIAVLTNIYPDHLNFYNNMQEYIDDKMQIFSHQKKTDYFVTLTTTYQKYKKTIDKYLRSKLVLVDSNYYKSKFKYLLGDHNQQNASLALKVGELMQIETPKIEKILKNSKPLTFRLEKIGTIKSAVFYNDSTSTTPTAGIMGLQSISNSYPQHQIFLIVGGKEKNLPYDKWLALVNKLAFKIYLLPGSFSDLIVTKIDKNKLTLTKDIPAIFNKIVPFLNKKKVVLFSPSATSFATFNNEFHRGEEFSKIFKQFQTKYGP